MNGPIPYSELEIWFGTFSFKKPFSNLASWSPNASTCLKRHLSALLSLQTVLFDTSFSIPLQGLFLHESPILSIKSENRKKISKFPLSTASQSSINGTDVAPCLS